MPNLEVRTRGIILRVVAFCFRQGRIVSNEVFRLVLFKRDVIVVIVEPDINRLRDAHVALGLVHQSVGQALVVNRRESFGNLGLVGLLEHWRVDG